MPRMVVGRDKKREASWLIKPFWQWMMKNRF